jgi:hypothetical protein
MSREKTQADFDLEKLTELLDEALTSTDMRVQNALRGLLTIVELTRTQDDGKMAIETKHGPLRQIQEDLKTIAQRLNNLENDVRFNQHKHTGPGAGSPYPYNPGAGSPFGPGIWTTPNTGNPPGQMPGGGTPWWGIDPNMPYTTSKASSSASYTLTDNEKDSTMATITITK